MSYGSVSERIMLARAMAAEQFGTFTSTGEGGYPDSLVPHRAHIITQIATGLFGVREETIQHAPIVEFKYAQGAKPGLGGHLLGDKTTMAVAKMRESVPWVSLFSPFPFHSVYSVEDHKKHLDWARTINPTALVSVKVSTTSTWWRWAATTPARTSCTSTAATAARAPRPRSRRRTLPCRSSWRFPRSTSTCRTRASATP
jgi:glutamate synthase domain-containing protein 2